MIYLQLFFTFFKIGCFSFGGAYGAIPLIRDSVLSNAWLDDENLSYMIGVSESTPGPIMLNLATYVGLSQAGIPGAIISNLAVVLPSFIIILIVTALFNSLLKNKIFQMSLNGVKPCIIGVICATGIFMTIQRLGISITKAMSANFQWNTFFLTFFLSFILFGLKFFIKRKVTPIIFILISALSGIIIMSVS